MLTKQARLLQGKEVEQVASCVLVPGLREPLGAAIHRGAALRHQRGVIAQQAPPPVVVVVAMVVGWDRHGRAAECRAPGGQAKRGSAAVGRPGVAARSFYSLTCNGACVCRRPEGEAR